MFALLCRLPSVHHGDIQQMTGLMLKRCRSLLRLLPCLLFAIVTGYHLHTPTALGTKPRPGVAAGPRRHLGAVVRIGGRRYRVEDVHPRGGWDVYLPSARAARKWGRKRMHVRIVKPARRAKR